MAKKKQRRRAKKYFSVWNAAVAYGNLSILTRGALGPNVGPLGFITGETDLKGTSTSYTDAGLGASSTAMRISGGTDLSLGDVLTEPTMAWDIIQSNVKTNAVGMAGEAIIFNTSATVLRRLLRAPINSANRLIRPLGLGVKI